MNTEKADVVNLICPKCNGRGLSILCDDCDWVNGGPRKLWGCGEYVHELLFGGVVWEFVGVFTTKEKAIEACANDQHFIAPIMLDKALFPRWFGNDVENFGDDGERRAWPGAEYPLGPQKKRG